MKHYVRVCRPRFELAIIEVDADDEESAQNLALVQAEDLTVPKWWLGPFDQDVYRPHVERCLSEQDPAATIDDGVSPPEALAQARSLEPDEYNRYQLLHADANSGEGEVLMQPWFLDHDPDLMEHDLCSDWIAILKRYVSEVASFEQVMAAAERAFAGPGE